jgi:hypothetical protein
MIKKIHVQDVYEAEKIAGEKHDWTVFISLFDPTHKEAIHRIANKNLENKNNLQHHVEWFEDIDEEWMNRRPFTEEEVNGWIEDPFHYNKPGPSLEHISNIIELGKELVESEEEHNVLVHCHAGVSRSTATAIILRYMNGESEDESILNTLKDRYCSWPNQLMLRLADRILKHYPPYKTSNLYERVVAWKKAEKEKPFGVSF